MENLIKVEHYTKPFVVIKRCVIDQSHYIYHENRIIIDQYPKHYHSIYYECENAVVNIKCIYCFRNEIPRKIWSISENAEKLSDQECRDVSLGRCY